LASSGDCIINLGIVLAASWCDAQPIFPLSMPNVPLTTRRQFLLASSLTATSIALGAEPAAPIAKPKATAKEKVGPVPAITPVPGAAFLHAGPMVGHVTDTTARLWAKGSNQGRLAFKMGLQADLSDGRVVSAADLTESASFTGQVQVDGLQPATRYFYAPVLDGAPALARPYPSFVTAPAKEHRGQLRVAFGSCVGHRGYHAAAAFGEMAARADFDLLLMLGDNHYGDTTDPALLRDYYHMHRTVAGFEKLIREKPTYAIWDDHDFGPNNSDGTTKGKEDSLRVFQQWWANPGYGEQGNPGCYYGFARGGVDFFMLDSRYYRTPNKTVEDGKKTMLGARQLQWLKDGLAASKAPFKIVACGSEWQTLTQPDCWSSFARERQEIFDHITAQKIDGVVLLSGDRHLTAGYQIQGRHLEFTSGPLGSGNSTLQENPERFTGADEGKLWAVLDLDTSASPPSFHYEIWQAGGGLLERRALTWDEINGRSQITPSPSPLVPERMEKKAKSTPKTE
jgi:alkaline phosphatase D